MTVPATGVQRSQDWTGHRLGGKHPGGPACPHPQLTPASANSQIGESPLRTYQGGWGLVPRTGLRWYRAQSAYNANKQHRGDHGTRNHLATLRSRRGDDRQQQGTKRMRLVPTRDSVWTVWNSLRFHRSFGGQGANRSRGSHARDTRSVPRLQGACEKRRAAM